MYCPHTVSLINYHNNLPHLTVLRGVMLQGPDGRAVLQRGAQEEGNVILYIPFSVRAENPGGGAAAFLPPKEYAAADEPARHWTLQAEGESGGRSTFFVKGELAEALTLAEARERYDCVYAVAGCTAHDYGTPAMRHWEAVSKVSSRFYQYS